MSINTNRSSPTQINTSTNNYAMTPKQVSSSWSQISVGPSHTLAIATDGTLYAWGYNNVGQIGNSSLINQSSPVQIATGSWTHVHADINYSIALRDDDLLFGWGYNQYGQLGTNIPVGSYRSSPVQVNSTSWSTVSSGTNHTAAIKSDNTLWAWGYNNLGQLGNTSYINTSSPIQIGTSSYSQVGAGSNYTTALTTNNKIVTFGDNTYGQLGYTPSSNIQSWTMIAANAYFTIAIRNDGLLFGWGNNTNGQLGLNDTINRSSPTQIGTNSWNFVSVNAGTLTATAIRSDGTLWAWGYNVYYQVGDNTLVDRSSPVQVSIGGSWTSVTTGDLHTLAINTTGALYAWGRNDFGQTGTGTTSARVSSPVQIGTSSWSQISAGNSYTAGITVDGKLYTWGVNTGGILGQNNQVHRSSPVQVGSSSWIMVYATFSNSIYAIKLNKKLYAFGQNNLNQLGNDKSTDGRSNPVQIHSNDWLTSINSLTTGSTTTNGANFGIQYDNSLWAWGVREITLASDYVTTTFTYSWTQISSGDSHTVAIRSDGRLFAWGLNSVGQIGDNTVLSRSSPVQIGTSENEGEFWYNVSAKGSRTVAVRCDNTIWVWGLNSGYVGLNDNINRSSPVQITSAPVTSYVQVSAGIDHTLALNKIGQLYIWGNNNAYQLGTNDSVMRSSPVQLSGSFTQISAGNSHSLAVDSNSTLYVWGDNTIGQLGNSASLEYWSSVHIGIYSTTAYAIRNDGLLYSWGSDSSGNFGTNNAAATQRSSPVQIGTSSWSMIAAGRSHTLAIKADGTLWAWGANASGELADAIPIGGARSSPVQLGTSSWSFITAGYASSAGVDINGKLYTWGINTSGLLGTNDTLNRSNVTQIGTPSSWTQVGFTKDNAGSTFALRNDGSLFTWGPGGLGQLGDNATLTRSSPVQVHTGVKYTSISGGPTSMFGLRTDKTLWAWGFNNAGQLGDITVVNKSSPIQIASGYVFEQVAAGTQNVQALTTGGLMFGWGTNTSGQLGINDTLNRSSPVQIGTLSWEFLSTGNTTVFGITRGAAPALPNLYGWGDPITSGTTPARSSPVQVQAMTLYQFVSSPAQLGTSSWSSISAGGSYSLGVNSAGLLYSWGSNSDGQLGVIKSATAVTTPNSVGDGYIRTIDNNLLLWGYGAAGQIGDNQIAANKSTPFNVTATYGIKFKDFAQVKSSVSGYTLAISTDNNLWAWGANNSGGLGTGTTIFRSMPIQIGASSWTSVAVGLNFTIAIKSDNTLWGWGAGYPAAGAVSWQSVSAGASHTLILRSDKQLFGFGSNTAGQLGDNTVVAKSSPTVLHAGALYNSIAAGTNISAGIREDNTLWTWGINTNGALGLGDTLNRSSPVQVKSVTNDFWSQVTASDYMLAQSSTFGIYGWGLNTSGQLGNNDIVSRSSPVQLPFAGSIYSNYGSNFFNGSGAYLSTTSNAAFAFETGDYTIEAWVYRTDSGVQRAIVDLRGGANVNVLFYMLSSNKLAAFNSTSTWISSTNIIPLNQWTHVALTRTGTSATLFINGTVDGTATNSNNNVSAGAPYIGRQFGSAINDWVGYISNVRVIKGTALYTSTFTPSTSPLTTTSQGATASQVSLLTCQSNSFIDNSNNAFTLTQNGVITLSGLNPFLAPSGVNNTVVELSAGSASYIVNYDNKLYAWGVNANGQLGLNDTINRSSPVQIGTSSWTQISAGAAHVLGITSTGSLYAWGFNSTLQLGLNDTIARSSPVQVGTNSWSLIDAGQSHSVGIISNGTVWTWGANNVGQLGLSNTVNRSSPTQVGTSSYAQISAGGSQTVALTNDQPWQNLYTWGAGTLGLIGSNDTLNRSSPIQVGSTWLSAVRSSPSQISSSSDWSIISTADQAAYAIKNNGTLWTWGVGTNGRLGLNDTINRSSPTQIGTSSWTSVAGGRSFVAGITSDGTLYAWGQNNGGQLGQGNTLDRSTPTQIAGSYTYVSSGESHVVAIKSDGTIWAWGFGTSGQLGALDLVTRSSPVQVSTAVAFNTVTAGSVTSYGVKDNILYGWGGGTSGQLGDGTIVSKSSPIVITSIWYNNDFAQSSPTQVGSDLSWSIVAAGASTSMALESTGELFTWGNNTVGQMGNATTISRSSIVQIGTSSFTIIAAGGVNSYAIKPTTNLLFGWGNGGTVGDNTGAAKSSPVQVYTGTMGLRPIAPIELRSFLGSSYTQVNVGGSVITVASSDGLVYTWGTGILGQLGTQNINVVTSSPVLVGGQIQTFNASPAQISSGSYTQLSAGYRHALAIKDDSTLYGWGNFAATAPATDAYSWKKVAAGQNHFVAIRGDNTLWTWGLNTQGQLGTSDTVNRSVPVQIGTNTYSDIAAGASFTAAITTDYSLYAWGQNNTGQLGQGGTDTIARSSPVQLGSSAATGPTAYSTNFNGSQYFTVATNPAFIFGTGDFTIECWFYISSGTAGMLFDTRSGPTGVTPVLYFSASALIYYMNGASVITSPTTLLSNRWYHVALVRSSGSSTLFLNGVQTGSTYTDSNNFTLTNTINVGRGNDNANFLNGYISNLRVIKGAAIYTSSFTPSTSPLTTTSQGATASQVSLLTCQNKTLIDNSNNTFSISNVGASSGQLVSPFAGYSVRFSGSAQYLSLAANTAFVMGTGDFTTDAWIYPSVSASGQNTIVSWIANDGNTSLDVQYYTGNIIRIGQYSNYPLAGTIVLTPGKWYHVAVTRLSGLMTIWINGIQDNSVSFTTNLSASNPVKIGYNGFNDYFNGYISNIRIVKGTALYTTTFIPSIYNLPAVTNTSLLTCNSSSIIDYSTNNFTITNNGTATVSQIENPITYNASSITFNGTSQFLTVAAGAPGSGNYTIECWIYTSDYYNAAAYAGIFDSRASGTDAGGISLYFKRAGANLIYRVAGTDLILAPSATIQLNLWNHVAIVRNSGTTTMYINGASAGSASNSTNHTNTSFYIGKTFDPYYFGGYISNFRMVYGSAVYTSNFTVPTNPLTAITNTVLLTCQNPIIVDNSTNAFTITATGSPVEAAAGYTPFNAYLGSSSAYFSVRAGMSHAIALASDNTLYVWGNNSNGQLGTYNTTTLYQPTQITPTVSYVNITAGANHTGAIDTNQNLYLWGFNVGGQLGQSNVVARSSPTQVGTLKWSTVLAVGIGTAYDFTMALRTDGTLWSWGYNSLGQLGINLTTNRSSPVQVGSEYWSSIYDGSNVQAGAVLAEKSDGLLFAWGLNGNGQLGLGDTLNRSSPVQLSTSFKFANSGAYSTDVGAFFDTIGQMYTAGNDAVPSGELGDGSRIARSSPVQIASYYPTSPVQISTDSWTQVSAGNDLSLGVRINNSLYAWGLNTNYQTGIGTGQAIVSSPVQIGTTISSASAGTTAGGYIKNA